MIKTGIIILIFVLVGILLVSAVLFYLSQTPLRREAVLKQLNASAARLGKADKHFSGLQALIASEPLGIHHGIALGDMSGGSILKQDTPFHVASVGKLFTAAAIYQLIDEGKFDLDTKITGILEGDRLKPLFTYEGVNYSDEVTIRQLLAHTSGAADYFSDPVTEGVDLMTAMAKDQHRFYTPDDLLAISSDRQKPFGMPGKSYHYSDTGYVLLGKIIEAVEEEKVEAVFERRFFKPLGMMDTCFALRSEPLSGTAQPMADLWLNGLEQSDSQALSVDWTGGGIVSTLEDLLRFSRALHGGSMLSKKAYETMFAGIHKFEGGIYTGTGGMEIRFKAFFPLLSLEPAYGHMGVLSTQLFYDPATQTHMVINFGSDEKHVESVRLMIEILSTLNRLRM